MATSGDLLADRRYAWAEGALEGGDVAGAIDLARQTVEIAPGFAAGWFLLGRAHERAGDREAARAAFSHVLALDDADALGAALRLCRLGVGEPLAAMSPAYTRGLFDDYAIRFDRHLVQSLGYRGPDVVHDAVRRACSLRLRSFRFPAAVDLGCGTGLAGARFRAECGTLAGVDLSSAMVKRAAAKRVYDDLSVADALTWLAGRPAASVDLVLAADVFVYVADLAPIFAAAARVLRVGGVFAFTAQSHDGQGIVLGADSRYAHAAPYLRETAIQAGLAVVLLENASIRQDRGHDVPGNLAVLERPHPRTAPRPSGEVRP